MLSVVLVFIGSLFASSESVLTINNTHYTFGDFYDFYPKSRWAVADSIKREEVYLNFIKRQLCILEAKRLGLNRGPFFETQAHYRLRQLLVNEAYEQLVAVPLIDDETIKKAHLFAKTDIFAAHILVGYFGSQLKNPQTRSLDEALVLALDIKNKFNEGVSFADLAKKYSDDSSSALRAGLLGWIGWGQTVTAFEEKAFSIKINTLSSPVLTRFGYHLILVEDKRSSGLALLSVEEYESAVINLSKKSVRDKLRSAAINYDSLQLEGAGLVFNFNIINTISNLYNKKSQEYRLAGSAARVGVVDILSSLNGVVCVYNNKGFGGRWFANKMKDLSVSQMPVFDSNGAVTSMFKTIVLQELAATMGRKKGVESSFNYKKRASSIVGGLLYDGYLRFLINSSAVSDSNSVTEYYNQNKIEKYSNKSLDQAYAGIEVYLTKQNQHTAKKAGVDSLFYKYSIIKNTVFLNSK